MDTLPERYFPTMFLLTHTHTYFKLNNFIFKAVLGLQKNRAESTEISHMPRHSLPSTVLTSGNSVVHLLQLMSQQ